MQEQTKAMYGDNPMLSSKLWGDFLNFQGPAMQNMMSSYLDQSTSMFLDMQNRMQEQARTMFSGFGFPAYPPARDEKEEPSKK